MPEFLHNKYVLIGGAGILALLAFVAIRNNAAAQSNGGVDYGAFQMPLAYASPGASGAIDTSAVSSTSDTNAVGASGLDAGSAALIDMQTHQMDQSASLQLAQINADRSTALATTEAGLISNLLGTKGAKGAATINANVAFTNDALSVQYAATQPITNNAPGPVTNNYYSRRFH